MPEWLLHYENQDPNERCAPIGETWQALNNPGDILQWDATDDWRTTHAANDLTVGGQRLLCIEGNDASWGFSVGRQRLTHITCDSAFSMRFDIHWK